MAVAIPSVPKQHSTESDHSKLFYGWWIVVVSGIGLCFGFAPIVVYSFGVFIKPVAEELQSNRASISFAFTVANLMTGISSPVSGRLADRFGARRIILASIILFSLLLFSSQLLPAKLWSFYVFYGLLGFVGSGVAPIPYGKVVARWFDRRRGLALGLTMCGIGAGAILMPALPLRLIALLGWRSAYSVTGLILLFVALPVVGFFLKECPEDLGLLPDGALTALVRPAETKFAIDGVSWPGVWRSSAFWLIVGGISLAGASIHGCVIHLTPLLNDAGASANRQALATTVLGIALLIGRVGSGYFARSLLCAAGGLVYVWPGRLWDRTFANRSCLKLGLPRRVFDRPRHGRRSGHPRLPD